MKKPLVYFLAAVTTAYIGSASTNVSAIFDWNDVTFSIQDQDEASEVVVVPETTDDGKVINEVYLEDDPGIKKVVLPDTVNEVEVIRCTGITEFSVSENNPYLSVVDGILYDKEQKTLMCYPAGRTDTEFHIPETVEVVGKCAFAGVETLEKVYIPSSVRKIENSAFAEMKAKEFIFSEGVTDIEKYAFYECTELEKITLPASLERIERPFEGCTNLNEIIILHTDYKGNGASATIDPKKDAYNGLLYNCENAIVYVPDEDYDTYLAEVIRDENNLQKISEYPYKKAYELSVNETKIALEEGQTTGDIDGSGKIDVTDLTELSLYLLGDRELTENQQKSADVDSDGAVTLADLARLRQYLSKKIDTLETSYSPEDITDKCRTIIANASYVISGEPCFMVSSMEEYNERIARYEMEAEQIKEQGVTIDEKFFENNRLAVIVDNPLSAYNVVFTQTAVKLDEKGNVHLYYNRDFLHFGSEIAGLLHHITIVPGNPHNDSKAYVHIKDIMPVTDLTDKCLITNSSAVGYTGKDTFPVSTGMITSMDQFKEQFTDNGIDPYGAVKELGISDEFFKDHFLFYHTKYETTDNPKSRITSVRIDKDMNLTMDITTRTNVTEDPSGIPVSVGNSVMVNWFLAAAVPKAEVDPSEVASVDFIGISETETIK